MPDNRSIPYTHEMKSAFLAECARTGNGTHLLLKRMTDLPQGLTITIIGKWRNDASLTTIHEVHWCYVMNFLASLPSVSQPVSIEHKKKAYTGGRPEHRPISDRTLAELRFQYKRTGVGIDKLWREADNKPASLSSSIIKGWMSGQVRSAIPKHVRYVLDYYKSLPDKHPM
ncbi:MAG: hypothetical protein E2598_06100 [Sphingobium sp.]|nr:hypothetical protein [Sphingobium sp.]